MAVSQKFMSAVEQNDVRLVRIMISDSLVVDPTFREFEEKWSAAKNMDGLYDVHDGEVFKTQSTEWTNEYENEQMRKVITNFSKERLEILKKICTHIRGDMATKIENERKAESTRLPKQAKKSKQLGTGILVAGTAVTAIGAIASQAVIIAMGIVTMVVGGAIIITAEKEYKK